MFKNKGLFSFLILLLTTIMIGGVAHFSNLNYEELKFKANSIKGEENEILSVGEEENKKNYIEQNKEEAKKETDEEKIDYSIEDKKGLENPKLQDKEGLELEKSPKEDSMDKSYDKEDEESIKLEENKKVFKVDKYSIPKRISKEEKLKLINISKSFSLRDYGILLKHVKRSDELDAAIDIFKILKGRLKEDDYREVKDILSPYINIELIEDSI